MDACEQLTLTGLEGLDFAFEVLLTRPAALLWVAHMPELEAVGIGSGPASSIDELGRAVVTAAQHAVSEERTGSDAAAWRVLLAKDRGVLRRMLDDSARAEDDWTPVADAAECERRNKPCPEPFPPEADRDRPQCPLAGGCS